jgi:hypothetical protein
MMGDRRRGERRLDGPDSLLTDLQVAKMASVPVRTVRYWRLAGILPSVKVGRHPRIWMSMFQKVFHQPTANGPWELVSGSDKIQNVRDIRRK